MAFCADGQNFLVNLRLTVNILSLLSQEILVFLRLIFPTTGLQLLV